MNKNHTLYKSPNLEILKMILPFMLQVIRIRFPSRFLIRVRIEALGVARIA